jgi:biopolymer transport protein ExbB
MFTEFNWIEATGGSPIFMVLIGCSIVALAIALERLYYFMKHSGNPDEALAACLKKIKLGDLKAAAWVCESTSHPLGAVAKEVFDSIGKTVESLEERLQVALSQQKLLLERNLSLLGTLAAIAPLIGLLGTVWGIMRAFHDMAATGSAAPTVVAAGVAEALITTAAGLVVAVPSLILYNHFASRMNVMLTVAENSSRTLRTAIAETHGIDGRTGSESDKNDKNKSERQVDSAQGAEPEPAGAR